MSGYPAVVTLTANPLWETTWTFGAWSVGGTWRAREASQQVGGKGVNVARVVSRVGLAAEAVLPLAGPTGAAAEAWLIDRGDRIRRVEGSAPTREGVVVRCAGREDTTFLGPDNLCTEAVQRELARALPQTNSPPWVAVCGSVPGFLGAPEPELAGRLAAIAEAGRLVVDSYGPFLGWALGLPVSLVKINRAELAGLVQRDVDEATLGPALSEAARWAPKVGCWIITDGAGPVWICDGGTPAAVPPVPPAGAVAGVVGAGDALLAGLLAARCSGAATWRAALDFGLELAAAKVASVETTDFPLGELPRRLRAFRATV